MRDYRKNELTWLALFYTVMFFLCCTDVFSKASTDFMENQLLAMKLIKGVLLSSIVPLFSVIIDSIFSSSFKDRLVGCFILRRTGEKVFSIIQSHKFKDKRIDSEKVNNYYKSIIDSIPKEKNKRYQYENDNWYKIYKKYDKEGAIIQTQKDYLMCRDMYVQTITAIIGYLFALMFFKSINFSLNYLILLLIMALVLNISTNLKMKRFVYTVIVTDVSSQNNE